MSITWSDEETTLLESVRPVLSTREIHKVFQLLGYQRSMEAIQKRSRKIGVTFKDFGTPVTHGLTHEEKTALTAVMSEREGYLAACSPPPIITPAMKGERTKQQRLFMADILEELNDIRAQVPRLGSVSLKRSHVSEKQSLVVLLSDWHLGQIVTDTEHNRVIYNTDIAVQRILSIPAKVVQSLSPDQMDNIDECVLLLAGDTVSGEGIFKHHEMYIHEHAAEQVLVAVKATWEMIQGFRDVFPLVRIVTTKGNHGRTGGSPEANWDNIIYQQLELLVDLDGGSNITIKNRYGNYATVDVRGWKGHIRHWAPSQFDTAAGIAKAGSWAGMHDWDFFCYGHWHHWGCFTWNGQPLFRNGSLVGGDDYSESLAKVDLPVQLIFGVSDNQIGTFINPVRI